MTDVEKGEYVHVKRGGILHNAQVVYVHDPDHLDLRIVVHGDEINLLRVERGDEGWQPLSRRTVGEQFGDRYGLREYTLLGITEWRVYDGLERDRRLINIRKDVEVDTFRSEAEAQALADRLNAERYR